jgi:hypothetical protein
VHVSAYACVRLRLQDGAYFPRIFFLNGDEAVDNSLYNRQGSPNYKYYYRSRCCCHPLLTTRPVALRCVARAVPPQGPHGCEPCMCGAEARGR